MTQQAKLESSFDIVFKRHGYVVAFSAFVGALTDFFSPLGGLYISLTIAGICTLFMLLIWANKEWLAGLIGKSEFLRKWVDDFLPSGTTCLKTPLFNYFAIGAVVFGYTGYVTKAHADDGGMLASSFDQVRSYQSMMGIMKSVDDRVRGIESTVSSMDRKLDNVKKERSEDPRIQLANEGAIWSHNAFIESLDEGDLRRIALYLDGGMKMDAVDMTIFMRNFDAEIGTKILHLKRAAPVACDMPSETYVESLKSSEKIKFLHAMCSSSEFKKNLIVEMEENRAEAERQLMKKNDPAPFLRRCITDLSEGWPPRRLFIEGNYYKNVHSNMSRTYSPTAGILSGVGTQERKEWLDSLGSRATWMILDLYLEKPMTKKQYDEAIKGACEEGAEPDEYLITKYEKSKQLLEKIFY